MAVTAYNAKQKERLWDRLVIVSLLCTANHEPCVSLFCKSLSCLIPCWFYRIQGHPCLMETLMVPLVQWKNCNSSLLLLQLS